jgi:GDPmannose 4,6-dehydratase
MWRILQKECPEDFVVATGETHSLKKFVAKAFDIVGLNAWEHVDFDPGLLRPSDIARSCGDPSKATNRLSWRAKTNFEQIVEKLIASHGELEAR